ncbi:MAG TPA: hypothetical protein VGH28_12550 [Polyangiaceae bacterium]|jgi:hypothetical protein
MSLRAIVFAACTLAPAIARGQDKAACLHAHVHGQELRIAGKWRAARAEFATCSAAACPSVLSKDCITWNAELEEKIPTVVVVAHGPAGEDTLDASLDVDGAHRSDSLSGAAIELDPGAHVLTLRHHGWADASKQVVVHEGDRDERVEISFSALAPLAPREPPRRRGIPMASIVLTVLGGVALGTGAALDVSGGVDYNLGCYGRCTSDQASSINTRFLAGDVTLAVGLVSLGVALVVALVGH